MIAFDLDLSPTYLKQLVNSALDDAFDPKGFDTNGISVFLSRIGDTHIGVDGEIIFISLPLSIKFNNEAGLFSMSGNGSVTLDVATQYRIDEKLNLRVKSDIVGHTWLTKPQLSAGSLSMPVETLVNLLFKHYESIITSTIDQKIMESISLKSTVQTTSRRLNEKVSELKVYGMSLDLSMKSLSLLRPRMEDDSIKVSGVGNVNIQLKEKGNVNIDDLQLWWLDNLNAENLLHVNGKWPLSELKDLLLSSVKNVEVGGKKLVIDSSDMRNENGTLVVDGKISSPVVADVRITTIPVYNEFEGELYLQDIDVHLKPDSFIYKLSAPIVNKFIENKLEDLSPIGLNKLLSEGVEKLLSKSFDLNSFILSISLDQAKVKSLELVGDDLDFQMMAKNGNIKIASV